MHKENDHMQREYRRMITYKENEYVHCFLCSPISKYLTNVLHETKAECCGFYPLTILH